MGEGEAVIGGSGSDLSTILGDPGEGKSLIGNIGGSTTSVQSALNTLSIALVNNQNFPVSLVSTER